MTLQSLEPDATRLPLHVQADRAHQREGVARAHDALARAGSRNAGRRPRSDPRSARSRRAARARPRPRSAPGRASSPGRSRRAPTSPRTMASAPRRRSCELVPASTSSSRNSTAGVAGPARWARAMSTIGADPGNLGEEPRLAGLQRILDAQRGADAKRGHAQRAPRAPARRPGPAPPLMPTVRSSVLLPDMFEPLTSSTRGPSPPSATSLATARPGGNQRMREGLGLEDGRAIDDLGKGIARDFRPA